MTESTAYAFPSVNPLSLWTTTTYSLKTLTFATFLTRFHKFQANPIHTTSDLHILGSTSSQPISLAASLCVCEEKRMENGESLSVSSVSLLVWLCCFCCCFFFGCCVDVGGVYNLWVSKSSMDTKLLDMPLLCVAATLHFSLSEKVQASMRQRNSVNHELTIQEKMAFKRPPADPRVDTQLVNNFHVATSSCCTSSKSTSLIQSKKKKKKKKNLILLSRHYYHHRKKDSTRAHNTVVVRPLLHAYQVK